MEELQRSRRLGRLLLYSLVAGIAVLTIGSVVVTGEPTAPAENASTTDAEPAAEAPPADAPHEPPVVNVPEGFIVEVVAGPPLVSHPMMAGFDDRGRLYVADALGVNLNAEELQRDLPNRIQRLEDTDGDGRFDRATTFADKMTFPMGAVWYRGAVYTASPPYIWRLEDTDDDGVADKREQIVGKFGFIGNAADIHGCFLGPEGRIYWCDGRHGHEFVDANGETLSKGQAARIFSCRPDGSDVQVYAGGGMDNPVEVAFTAEGEMLGTMTFYNPDETRHDALVHYAYGGVYPRKHAVVEEFKRTGDFMPPLSLYGTVAPAGLTRYSHTAFGPAYKDNFFSVQFNTHKVIRHILTREKSSFTAVDEDFLTSPSIDFHPTDVLEDADGSLLVIDTGGWFRHGCPTSQIAKPEILGAIYRIRRAGAPVDDDPRGRHLPWRDATSEDLAARLADRRPAVRERAVDALAQRGDSAVTTLAHVLKTVKSPVARQAAVWSLTRNGSSESRRVVRIALKDEEWKVRLTAVRSVSATRDSASFKLLENLLSDQEGAIRREATTALGRIGVGHSVPKLLQTAATTDVSDRHLEHSVIYALIEIGDFDRTMLGLSNTNHPSTQRAALIALDQMSDSKLTSTLVVPLLEEADEQLLRAAVDVFSRRPSWSTGVASLARKWLVSTAPKEKELQMLRGMVVTFETNRELQQLTGDALHSDTTPRKTRIALLDAIARSSLPSLPEPWQRGLASNLKFYDADVTTAAIAAAQTFGGKHCEAELSVLVADKFQTPDLRRSAACALAHPDRALEAEPFTLLVTALVEPISSFERMVIARALGNSRLDAGQLRVLVEQMNRLGPMEVSSLMDAFRGQSDPEIGNQLLGCLNRLSVINVFSQQQIEETFQSFPQEIRTQAEGLVVRQRNRSTEMRSDRLEQLSSALEGGDAKNGREIFYGNRAACAACHRIQSEGGQMGPDLSQIGAIRAPRDLLESIIVPSASLARGYESFSLSMSTGLAFTGMIERETATMVYLRRPNRDEVRLPRKEIEQIERSQISVMPEGLDRMLSNDEVRDLVAYLSSLK